jgi:hypothetical protein
VRHPELGPLAVLEGTWEGAKGHDTAPDDDRKGAEINLFREVLTFEFIGAVDNHEQKMFGLKYAKKAWRIAVADSFHEECGYWLWDAANKQVMRCFIVPRGVSVIAGATVEAGAKSFTLKAERGSPTYGICSNQFLDEEFRTLRFSGNVTVIDENTISYEEDTELQVKGMPKVFHHVDKNVLTRAK